MIGRRLLVSASAHLKSSATRDFGIFVPALQKATDPIQQLFIEKIREYKKKSPSGQLFEPSPEIQRELNQELSKLAIQYGGDKGADMTKFPDFKFVDPQIDPINLETK